jgi:hypothetical protein
MKSSFVKIPVKASALGAFARNGSLPAALIEAGYKGDSVLVAVL